VRGRRVSVYLRPPAARVYLHQPRVVGRAGQGWSALRRAPGASHGRWARGGGPWGNGTWAGYAPARRVVHSTRRSGRPIRARADSDAEVRLPGPKRRPPWSGGRRAQMGSVRGTWRAPGAGSRPVRGSRVMGAGANGEGRGQIGRASCRGRGGGAG